MNKNVIIIMGVWILYSIIGCRQTNNDSEDGFKKAQYDGDNWTEYEIQLESLRSSYLEKYGATHNLLHFSEYLTEQIMDEGEGASVHYLFLKEIIEKAPGWHDLMEDPLIYFVKDFEIKYLKNYPGSPHKEAITKLLSGYFINEKGEEVFDLITRDTAGNMITLKNYPGNVIVLDFWATWCLPCLEQMPYLEKIKEEYAGKGVVFITVNMNDEEEKWLSFIRTRKPENEITTRLPQGGNDPQATAMGVNALPVYQFIDKHGKYITQDGPKPASVVFAAILEQSIQ